MVAFAEVLAWLETEGWALHRIVKPYRVFIKPGRLPLIVEVRPGGKVSDADDQRIREIVTEDSGRRPK